MSEQKKKKKSLSTLWADIKVIRERRPSDEKIEEMNKVIEQGMDKTKTESFILVKPEACRNDESVSLTKKS